MELLFVNNCFDMDCSWVVCKWLSCSAVCNWVVVLFLDCCWLFLTSAAVLLESTRQLSLERWSGWVVDSIDASRVQIYPSFHIQGQCQLSVSVYSRALSISRVQIYPSFHIQSSCIYGALSASMELLFVNNCFDMDRALASMELWNTWIGPFRWIDLDPGCIYGIHNPTTPPL